MIFIESGQTCGQTLRFVSPNFPKKQKFQKYETFGIF